MGVNNNITNALNTELASINNLPVIYLPNNSKERNQNVDYIRPTVMPARTRDYTLADEHYWSGIYQIDVYTNLKKGSAPAQLIADAISEHFDRITINRNGVQVNTDIASLSVAQVMENKWHLYVEVPYWCTYKP